MTTPDAQLLGRREAALKIAQLAESYLEMSTAHSAASIELLDTKQVEAARLLGEAQAYHQIATRLIALVTELKG